MAKRSHARHCQEQLRQNLIVCLLLKQSMYPLIPKVWGDWTLIMAPLSNTLKMMKILTLQLMEILS